MKEMFRGISILLIMAEILHLIPSSFSMPMVCVARDAPVQGEKVGSLLQQSEVTWPDNTSRYMSVREALRAQGVTDAEPQELQDVGSNIRDYHVASEPPIGEEVKDALDLWSSLQKAYYGRTSAPVNRPMFMLNLLFR
ncbi:hypothetical protein Pst134EA_025582 [Puccinia striiformis f. sp. tritici]|nr:hypothetical protein Pst134EA_025582 [Puccinia striiformis f. sp. tritici]KAH9451634.1 hypothetical protein Pst134EA_025582 [Puccinia striiformis f. sp. tritici]KAI9627315.1 hypothetical protein KEM48_009942 [Puccinia striiformis f. sp. tritici PST-130]